MGTMFALFKQCHQICLESRSRKCKRDSLRFYIGTDLRDRYITESLESFCGFVIAEKILVKDLDYVQERKVEARNRLTALSSRTPIPARGAKGWWLVALASGVWGSVLRLAQFALQQPVAFFRSSLASSISLLLERR